MIDPTGALHHTFGGKEYALVFSNRAIGKVQSKWGKDLDGLLTGGSTIPNFSIMADIIAAALVVGSKLPEDEAEDLGDLMSTADRELVNRLIAATFPDIAEGNAPKKAKAAG